MGIRSLIYKKTCLSQFYLWVSLLVYICFHHLTLRAAEKIPFDEGWRFTIGDSPQMASSFYDDSMWRLLNLPHDWAIEGNFHEKNPSGAVGGALPGGVGWYRKHFTVADAGSTSYYIEFDGIYMNSTVYLNGHVLGFRPFGYIGFRYDMTPFLNREGDNVIAVRVDNGKQPNARWYSGCGIYRHTYLVKQDKLHIGHWGISLNTRLQKKACVVNIGVKVENEHSDLRHVKVRNSIIDKEGNTVSTVVSSVKVDKTFVVQQKHQLTKPHLWSLPDPYLYKVKTEVIEGKQVVDTEITTLGIRTIEFKALSGFYLNGENVKINGVCLHGDLGCLGSAIHEDALYRQLRTMREMGANAIRCSHNPPSPELLNMCDSMGLMVMDEAFDSWRKGKTQYDYSCYFDSWFERDLTDMVLRDRNHPCIILWSIGNEVLEQWSTLSVDSIDLDQINILMNHQHDSHLIGKKNQLNASALLTQRLVEIIQNVDKTRPITAGCNEVSPNNNLFISEALDIIGFNYHNRSIVDVPVNFPQKPFLMTESVSALQTRGYYMMPSDSIYSAPGKKRPYTDPTFMCSSYDNMRTSWGATHESTWDVVKHTPYCAGQFIWTGFDYIGEPTPFSFPARSSYFGIVDLAGFPKDVYYMYQSEWTDRPVLHLFPHWNWLEGQSVDIWCYYNHADEVELFLNGESQGIRSKRNSHQFHVMWRLTYEPGELRVVARKNGNVVGEKVIRTAGAPYQLRMISDKSKLKPDGKSLAFITVEVVDKDGNLCPWAENQIYFTVKGGAKIVGVDNGSPISMERFQANNRKAFFGKCLVVLQSVHEGEDITLTAQSIGLATEILKLKVNTNN